MALLADQHRVIDHRTQLNASFFNPLIQMLDSRIHSLEKVRIDWNEAVSELQTLGLKRINSQLVPVLESAQASVTQMLESTTSTLSEVQSTTSDSLDGMKNDLVTWKGEMETWMDGFQDHPGDTGNPHGVTPQQIGAASTGHVHNHWELKSGHFTAEPKTSYFVDTTAGTIHITLPPTPQTGDTVSVCDAAGSFHSHSAVFLYGTDKIMGLAENSEMSTRYLSTSLVYCNSAYGWRYVG